LVIPAILRLLEHAGLFMLLIFETVSRFTGGKLYTADTVTDAQLLVRAVTQQKGKVSRVRQMRSHVLAESIEFTANPDQVSNQMFYFTVFLHTASMSPYKHFGFE